MKLGAATLNDAQHQWMKRFAAAIETKSVFDHSPAHTTSPVR
jgi:hypothetical protein